MAAEKFVVLGSNSFSGASFAAHLLKDGAEVIGVSRSAEPHEAFLPYRWGGAAGAFRFHQLDLNNDTAAIAGLIETERPAYVVNFAAQSMVGESWRNPDHWFMTNVVSTVRLHDALRQMAFLKAYVHVTTPEVYGSTEGAVREDAPFNPSTPYAVSRAAGDMSLRTYFASYKFPVLFTRAANVFGPGQQLYRIGPRAVLFARLGRKLPLHGGGHSVRSFIHIDDVALATALIAHKGNPGETYHISTPRMIAIRDLVQLIATKMGVNFSDLVEETGDRLGKDATYWLDSTKLRTELGWQDHKTLEQGIDEMIAWVDRYFGALKAMPFDYQHRP